MKRMIRKGCGLAAVLVLGTMLSGCVFLGDLLNTDFATSLGVPVPSQSIGSIVVRLRNDTNQQAVVAASVGSETSFSPLTASPAPGQAQNFVVDCPVSLIRPAGVAEGVAVTALDSPGASVILADGMVVDVTYTGSTLTDAGFSCGDVVEVRLIQIGAGVGEADFAITVQVFKGS